MLQRVQQDDFPYSQEHPTLAVAEIHVWRAALDVDAAALQRLHSLLAEDELARAARYRFALPRRRFVVARGILRLLLGKYLGISPAEVRFSYTPQGKPALSAPEHAWLHFNLAHSEDWALYAVAHGRAVGVDIERVRSSKEGIASWNGFSPLGNVRPSTRCPIPRSSPRSLLPGRARRPT